MIQSIKKMHIIEDVERLKDVFDRIRFKSSFVSSGIPRGEAKILHDELTKDIVNLMGFLNSKYPSLKLRVGKDCFQNLILIWDYEEGTHLLHKVYFSEIEKEFEGYCKNSLIKTYLVSRLVAFWYNTFC